MEDLPNSAELRQVAFPEAETPADEITGNQPDDIEGHTIPIRDASQAAPLNQPESPDDTARSEEEASGGTEEQAETGIEASSDKEPAETAPPS